MGGGGAGVGLSEEEGASVEGLEGTITVCHYCLV
jgi:hypothetical protein